LHANEVKEPVEAVEADIVIEAEVYAIYDPSTSSSILTTIPET